MKDDASIVNNDTPTDNSFAISQQFLNICKSKIMFIGTKITENSMFDYDGTLQKLKTR